VPIFGVTARLATLLATVPFSIGLAAGQSVASTPRFDVASVKPVPYAPSEFRAVLGTAVNGEVRLTDATLMECLRFAFGINNNFQIVGPDWMQSREYVFNVTGKAPANTSLEQLRLMLQNLLAERFQMAWRRESRDLSFLTMVVAKTGLKLRAAKEDSDASGNTQAMGKIFSNSISMIQLSTLLSHFLGEPVLDMTGMQGFYDVKLQWTPEADTAPADTAASAVSAALEAQLGLALELRKGPLEVVVVEHAEKKPIGN
jgi:uncharacterized protein (TIGR03435 family)